MGCPASLSPGFSVDQTEASGSCHGRRGAGCVGGGL